MKKLFKIISSIIVLAVTVSLVSIYCSAEGDEDVNAAIDVYEEEINSNGMVGKLVCTDHIWEYSWDGHSLNSECLVNTCGKTAELRLREDALYSTSNQVFCYCSGKEIDMSEFVVASELWNSDYECTYASMDGENSTWQIGLPTENGTYKIAIRMPESVEVEDLAGNYGDWNEFICVKISSGHFVNDEWTTDGTKLCNNCVVCGERIAEISINNDESVVSICTDTKYIPGINTWYIDSTTEEEISNNFPTYGYLYEGKSKAMKKKYPLQTQVPDVVGTYNIYIALYSGDEFTLDSVTLKTDPVDYEVKAHLWEYTSDEYTLYADCSVCEAHAEACLNTSTVYEASRNFSAIEVLDYDVFYETNWSEQEGIASYSVLFTGKETGKQTSYDRAFTKPKTAGNYDVRLALLAEEDDVDSIYLSTKEKHFYLADISIVECDILTYGNTQIAQFPEPEMKDGYYQVGTKDELLWCLYEANTTANIELTNDIVVNPITVDDSGNVYCAEYQIYLWDGFGTTSTPYTGSIRGNGYTIYGLYMPNISNQYSGLIDFGKNCSISDLTVENSVLYGIDAGSIVARYDITGSGTSRTIYNCQSLNCYISGSSTEAGIVSFMKSDKGTVLNIESCGSDSIINGDATRGAGGIIGWASGVDGLFIKECYNLGSVTGKGNGSMAGGIIGRGNLDTADAVLALWLDFNTGTVNGTKYEGGIAGYLKDYGKNKIYFDGCSNTGFLGTSTNVGGIAGYINSTYINNYYSYYAASPNFYYNAKTAFNTADSDVSLEDWAYKIKKSEVVGGFICSMYGHIQCSHWNVVSSASCTKDGELTLECAVCGSLLEDKIIRAYGHHFTSWGECDYCGLSIEDYEEQLAAAEDGMTGSVFGRSPAFVALIAGGALMVLMVAWLIINRKRQHETEK